MNTVFPPSCLIILGEICYILESLGFFQSVYISQTNIIFQNPLNERKNSPKPSIL